MITICHPRDEIEQMFLVSVLECAEIPYFINAQHFGSLYPGIQIPWYNERAIRVPPSCVEKATEIIEDFRSSYISPSDNLKTSSKFRILIEAIVCGWVVPYGNKHKSL